MSLTLEKAILESLKENKSPGQSGDTIVVRPPVDEEILNNMRAPVGIYFVLEKDFERQTDGSTSSLTSFQVELWYPNVKGVHAIADNAADRLYDLLGRTVVEYTIGTDNSQEQGVQTAPGLGSGNVIKVIELTLK